MEGLSYLRNIQDELAIWYKDASRNIHRIRGEFWRRMDWHVENNVASEVHVEKFKSKEVRIF